jgi:hypothetical protein
MTKTPMLKIVILGDQWFVLTARTLVHIRSQCRQNVVDESVCESALQHTVQVHNWR